MLFSNLRTSVSIFTVDTPCIVTNNGESRRVLISDAGADEKLTISLIIINYV